MRKLEKLYWHSAPCRVPVLTNCTLLQIYVRFLLFRSIQNFVRYSLGHLSQILILPSCSVEPACCSLLKVSIRRIISEGWHNRFVILVGKHHPGLYSLLNEIQKEQADSEIMVTELSLGRRVKATRKRKWVTLGQNVAKNIDYMGK